jgi:hypothetical protein
MEEILEKFEITTSANDLVLISELRSMFEEYKLVVFIVSELEKMGCKKIKSNKKEFRNKWVMTNLKKRCEE